VRSVNANGIAEIGIVTGIGSANESETGTVTRTEQAQVFQLRRKATVPKRSSFLTEPVRSSKRLRLRQTSAWRHFSRKARVALAVAAEPVPPELAMEELSLAARRLVWSVRMVAARRGVFPRTWRMTRPWRDTWRRAGSAERSCCRSTKARRGRLRDWQ